MDMEAKAYALREAVEGGASNSDLVQMLAEIQAAERERCAKAAEIVGREYGEPAIGAAIAAHIARMGPNVGAEPTVEARHRRPVGDNATAGASRPAVPCRSGSARATCWATLVPKARLLCCAVRVRLPRIGPRVSVPMRSQVVGKLLNAVATPGDACWPVVQRQRPYARRCRRLCGATSA